MKKLFTYTVLALILSTSNAPVSFADEIKIDCPSGGSYQIVMPAGVATNGKSCTGSLVVDSRVKVIGKEAFAFSKISSLVLPDSVVSIEANGLSYMKLSSIELGNSLESLGFEALRMTVVNQIRLPNKLKVIGECALCDTTFPSIELPNSVVSIGRNAFTRYDSNIPLKSIEIPDSVTEIGQYAFANAQIQNIKIGKGLKTLTGGAFLSNKIKTLIIPDNITFIGAFAFKNNPLEEVVFGSKLSAIDSEAFLNTKLSSIELPDTVINIGTKAFAEISTLKKVWFSENFSQYRTSDNSLWIGDIFEGSYSISEVIYCGSATGFLVKPMCTEEKKNRIAKSAGDQKARFISEIEALLPLIVEENAKDAGFIDAESQALDLLKQTDKLQISITTGERAKISSSDDRNLANNYDTKGIEFKKYADLAESSYLSLVDKILLQNSKKMNVEGSKRTAAYFLQLQRLFLRTQSELTMISLKLRQLAEAKDKLPQTPAPKLESPASSSQAKNSSRVIKITCVKGKSVKIISGTAPRCPVGYKKK